MNTIDPLDDSLPELADSIAQCARGIEETFTRVGDRLGEGFTLFDTLNGSLSALSAELAGGDLETTRDALRRLAADLRAFGDGLPGEAATLQTIATRNADATQSLGRLREHLQLIAILARSTRIEAASVQSNRGDLRDFTDRIVALTGEAKATVDNCARDHDRLTSLLKSAQSRQGDFVAHYRDSLSRVASKLERSIEALDDRATRGIAATTDAAAQSAKLSMAVGGAIVAMQSGDSIRQRLEHCVTALRLAAGESGVIVAVLRRLEAAQLREAGHALSDEIGQIDDVLAALARDTASMLEIGRSVYGGGDASSRSFLEVLEGELSEASVLISKCDAARDGVDQATATLGTLLDQFQLTVSGLTETIQDIVMIGTNAGLMAVRLGSDGRGLVVIAAEVKSVADRISQDASRLNPIFASMQKASGELRDRDRRGGYDMASLDGTMRQSLDQMRRSGARLGATLERLARDGEEFGAIVGESRRMFADAAASENITESVADALGRSRSAQVLISPKDRAAVEELLRRRVWPAYTMSAERDIHLRVLDEFGLSTSVEAPRAAAG